MRIILTLLLALGLGLAAAAKPAAKTKPNAAPDPTAAARKASDAFIKLIDAGDYARAYASCASALRAKADQATFTQALTGLRGKLGANTLRHFLSATPHKELPGAPKGNYIVLVYISDFHKQKGLKEIVTPMQEKDGSWKVSGYYVQH